MMNTKIKAKIKTLPYITIAIIAANVIYFLILASLGRLSDSRYMLSMGADFAPYVFKEFQVWRLITCMFVHFSLSHLAGNMIYLAIIGFQFERGIGHFKFFLIYMLSGIAASLVSCAYYSLTNQNVVSGGASGAVYGLMAMTIYFSVKGRKLSGRGILSYRLIIALVFLFYSNFASGSGVDAPAHVGGFAAGLLLSMLFFGKKFKKRR